MSLKLQSCILRFLDTNPHLSQRGLSKSIGASLGGINYLLSALISRGAIKIEDFKNNQNKWMYAYLLTPQGIAEKAALTGFLLKRKMQEYEQSTLEIESLTREAKKLEIAEEAEIITRTSLEDTYIVKAGVKL